MMTKRRSVKEQFKVSQLTANTTERVVRKRFGHKKAGLEIKAGFVLLVAAIYFTRMFIPGSALK